MKKTVESLSVNGKKVLVRLDLNVPLDQDLNITDDRRIQSALPTVKKLIDGGAMLILMSHLGRPTRDPSDKTRFSLKPAAERMRELLGRPVRLLPGCVGEEIKKAVDSARPGEVLMLENLRFNDAETIKDKKAAEDATLRARKDEFARGLAGLADAYVNDAFGTCHRDNASMYTVPKMMEGKPRAIGYLVERELQFLGSAVAEPKRPFVCVLGGAKVSDKLGVIRSLMTKCDTILIGGAMAYTFLKAAGQEVGKSLVEEDLLDTARAIRAEAGDKLMLPVDSIAAPAISADADTITCTDAIPTDLMGLDIGPETVEAYRNIIEAAHTIVWNGPMGVFETPPFDRGTMAVASSVADATDNGAVSIIGGGDSAAAIDKAGLESRISHISTGGGASLEYLEGKSFKPLEVIDEA